MRKLTDNLAPARRTVYNMLAAAADAYGREPALHQPDGKGGYRTYSWVEYRQVVEELAAGLRALGMKLGDVAANLALKERFGLRIVGPEAEKDRIPGIDETVGQGSTVPFGSETVEVISTPGHTAGHVSYYFPRSKVAFTADTLFALGCGRLLESPAAVMYESLKKLAALPADTTVYCGHEYTLANARFALTIDPDNAALQARARKIEALRAQDRPTLPTTIGEELATNPFLRWGDPAIRRNLGMENAPDAEVFAEIRKRKDNF